MEDKDQFVDELLDSALNRHRNAEPRAGLEGRILAHVRTASQESSRRRSRKLWFVAAATAAAVVVFIAIHVDHRPQSPAPQTSRAGNAVPGPSPRETLKANVEPTPATRPATKVTEPEQTARRESKPLRRVEAHHWPSQFPTPAPLSPEEKALVQYVRNTPPQVLAEPILKPDSTVQRVEVKPLEIPPLQIKPLALGPGHEEMR